MVQNPAFNAGDMGSIPGQGSKIPAAVEQLGPCASTTGWAHTPQLESPSAEREETKSQHSQVNKIRFVLFCFVFKK